MSEEQKEKMRQSHLGKKYKKMSDIGRENIRKAHLGYRIGEETKKKLSAALKALGLKRSEEAREHLREIHLGEKNPQWRGGVTPLYKQIRKSKEYKEWRDAVYKRDGYKCVFCKYKGKKLVADHIKPFAIYPELRLDIDNGRTLCLNCHKKTETYGKNYNLNSK